MTQQLPLSTPSHWCAQAIVAASIATIVSLNSIAWSDSPQPIRTWTDSSGKFSIEASLVEQNGARVRLMKANGSRFYIEFNKLSPADQQYLKTLATSTDTTTPIVTPSNALRPSVGPSVGPQPPTNLNPSPVNPSAETLPAETPTGDAETPVATSVATPVDSPPMPLKLPSATTMADDDAKLEVIQPVNDPITKSAANRPLTLPADPAPVSFTLPVRSIEIERFDGWAEMSPVHVIMRGDRPQLLTSITRGLSFPGGNANHRLIVLDLDDGQSQVAWAGTSRMACLDHHLPSGLTLVLTEHNSIGEGGMFALVKVDAARENVDTLRTILRRQPLPAEPNKRLAKVHWARLLDAEHVLAHIDNSLHCWNLLSAVCLYRIDGIEPEVSPTLSPGRRYLAIPRTEGVDLIKTETGQRLGSIAVDRKTIPSASFSPDGRELAIVAGKRILFWDLASAKVSDEVEYIRPLGGNSPVWVDSDLLLTSNGMLMSRAQDRAIWQYDIVGDTVINLGSQVALLRKYRQAEVAVLPIPHPAALDQLARIRYGATEALSRKERSKWQDGGWVDNR